MLHVTSQVDSAVSISLYEKITFTFLGENKRWT